MSDDVNKPSRKYDASRRKAAAQRTRARVLDAARSLFIANGYVATTVAAIAERASVSPDTVYTAVGAKPVLFAELIELALSGTDHAVEGGERDYALRIRAEPDAAAKLEIYATAVTELQARLAPLFIVLSQAAPAAPELATLWRQITDRRAANMRRLAADLISTGTTRTDLTTEEMADIIWTMNGSEYYALLVLNRGWPPARFEQWLHDAWCRLLLT